MNKDNSLSLVPPETLNPSEIFQWAKLVFKTSAERFRGAEEYFEAMRKYHSDLGDLMGQLTKLRKNKSPKAIEEAKAIAEVTSEIIEAIEELHSQQFVSGDSVSIDDLITELVGSRPGRETVTEVENDVKQFLASYFKLKAKLGLETQEDVSKVTGIDRRYISLIESGKHHPQFKTIKRIADGFGVPVEDLI